MMNTQQIMDECRARESYLIQMRRTVHGYAEIGGNEFDTRALIEKELGAEGIPFEELPGTGLIGILDTGRPGPHIALRADIDALPMKEEPENLKGPRTCLSRTPEKTAHMCGHDAHTAMLLGVMKALSANRSQLTGIIYFCFEQGEENDSGWRAMIAGLRKYRIDTCWGIHVAGGDMQTGMFNVQAGPRLAGAQFINFDFIGKGGHGSRPDQAINPVFCAANWYNNIAVAFANQIDANQTVTLGLTGIVGGTVGNVIPDRATVLGSLRFFDRKEGEKALRILHETAEHTAAMHHCTVDFANMEEMGIPTVNDDYYANLAHDALTDIFGKGLVPIPPQFGSESFSHYSEIAPSVFGFLGVGNPACGSGAGNHTGHFDVDEAALKLGMAATLRYIAAVEEKGVKH